MPMNMPWGAAGSDRRPPLLRPPDAASCRLTLEGPRLPAAPAVAIQMRTGTATPVMGASRRALQSASRTASVRARSSLPPAVVSSSARPMTAVCAASRRRTRARTRGPRLDRSSADRTRTAPESCAAEDNTAKSAAPPPLSAFKAPATGRRVRQSRSASVLRAIQPARSTGMMAGPRTPAAARTRFRSTLAWMLLHQGSMEESCSRATA